MQLYKLVIDLRKGVWKEQVQSQVDDKVTRLHPEDTLARIDEILDPED